MTAISQKAQVLATKRLREKYRDEYTEFYRNAVIELGGKVRSSKEERVAKLQAEIQRLEGN